MHGIAVVVVAAAAAIVETAPQLGLFYVYLCCGVLIFILFVCLFVFLSLISLLVDFPKALLIYNVKEFSGTYHLYIHKLLYYYVLGAFLNSVSVCEKRDFKSHII